MKLIFGTSLSCKISRPLPQLCGLLTAHIHIKPRQPKHTEVVKLPVHADGRKRIPVPNSRCLSKRCFGPLNSYPSCCCSLASAKFIKIVRTSPFVDEKRRRCRVIITSPIPRCPRISPPPSYAFEYLEFSI